MGPGLALSVLNKLPLQNYIIYAGIAASEKSDFGNIGLHRELTERSPSTSGTTV
jgi:hypothetical protein